MELQGSADERAEIGRLETLGAYDPAAPGIAAMAEAHRQAGEPDKALKLADDGLAAQPDMVAVRIARALALIDLGQLVDARSELTRVLDTVTDHPVAQALMSGPDGNREALADLDPGELDEAFRAAEPETDQMVSANDFAEAALQAVDDETDDHAPLALSELADDEPPSPYATETVADLLDEQGHGDEAAKIRLELPVQAAPESDGGRRVLPILERWLENLRRRTG
ncbi:MAG: hypothetical protein CL910_00415 [Deltaproteobacteria bacterium]|nr:hypothetical protein [Deltaproteobacteria bacterium]